MGSRLLNLLLCALLLGPMSSTAWAIARPENRVGTIFSSPLKTASADLEQTLGARQESRCYGYDFASGMRIYLYAADDPVNNIDPSGNEVQHAARDLDGVFVGKHHFLILIPDNPADFEGNSAVAKLLQGLGIQMEAIGGRKMIVVGAHNVNARLQVKFFQVADKTATRELFDSSYSVPWYQSDFDAEGHVIAAPSGKTDTQFITELLQATQNYTANENVGNIPYPKQGVRGKYNSNSWASSVLQHVGATPWPNFSGVDPLRDARIPEEYFKAGGVKPGAAPRPGSRLNISNQIPTYMIPLGF